MVGRGGGRDLPKALRASGSRIPFVVLTAFASRENPIAARRLGCDDIVPKPIVFDLPVAVLRPVPQRGGAAAPDQAQGPALTGREPEFFTWIARGTSSSDIARIVAISDLSPSPAESPARSENRRFRRRGWAHRSHGR